MVVCVCEDGATESCPCPAWTITPRLSLKAIRPKLCMVDPPMLSAIVFMGANKAYCVFLVHVHTAKKSRSRQVQKNSAASGSWGLCRLDNMNSPGAVRKMPLLSKVVNIRLTTCASCAPSLCSFLFFSLSASSGNAFTEFRNSNCPIFWCLLM